MANRFKGLDLIDRVPEELWMEIRNIAQEAVIKAMIKTILKKKKKKSKMIAWGSLTESWEKKRSERQREGERYTHLNAEFQRRASRD